MAKTDPDTWMWERAQALLDEADRMTRQFCRPVARRERRACWQPPIDIFETETDLWILAALPGVDVSRVEIVVDGAALVIRGERVPSPHMKGADVLRMEIPQGRFERRVELPRGRFQLAERTLDGGCLSIRLGKVL